MNIFDVIEKSEDFLSLKGEAEKGYLPKAILLISKDKYYVQNFATMVAMLVLDESCCRHCENCLKVEAGAHPDVKTYPEKERLMVADSEDIVLESFVKPVFANKKVFIVKDIDNAMEGAQNKLLKVLEEPSANVFLICTCSNIDRVLPTIRSRCNKITLSKVDTNQCLNLLGNVSEEKKELAIAVSDSFLGKAIEFCKMKDFEELCQLSVDILTKMQKSNQVLEYSKKAFLFKDKTSLIFEIISVLIEDLIKIKSGERKLVKLKNYIQQLEEFSPQYSIRALCEIALLIDKVSKETNYNVSPTVVFENFLLNILEVKYICR